MRRGTEEGGAVQHHKGSMVEWGESLVKTQEKEEKMLFRGRRDARGEGRRVRGAARKKALSKILPVSL